MGEPVDNIEVFIYKNMGEFVHVNTTLGFDYYGYIYDYDFAEQHMLTIETEQRTNRISIPKINIRHIEPALIQKKDNVNHPSHYQSKAGLEVIDVIKAFTEDLSGEEAFCTGNAIKYICRWKSKNGVEDLKKAKWYINRLITELEKERENHE